MHSFTQKTILPAQKIKRGEGTKFILSDIYSQLSTRTRHTLDKERMITELHKNQYLFRLRDEVDRIYIIRSGYAILERESDDHGVKSMLILRPGDIINEVILESPSASASLRALTDVTAVSFSRTVFWELMQEEPVLNRYVLESMAVKIRRLYRMLEGSTKTTRLDHQVASRLWKLAKDFGERKTTGNVEGNSPAQTDYIEIPFDVRITFLAGFVGSNRETVSRIVKKMSEAGILTIENGRCRIYDLEKLNIFRKDTDK